MNRIWKKLTTVAVLTVAVAAGACENLGDPTSPVLEPQAPSQVLIATENSCSVGAAVAAVVDGTGATLKVCNHQLIVPAGAVAGPTTFVMKKLDSDVKVDLTATSLGSLVPNNVGAQGFLKPLTLTLSYRNATKLPADLSAMKVYWLRPDGVAEAQASVLNVGTTSVTAYPTHFSAYGLGWAE